jgi:hypothetical protein
MEFLLTGFKQGDTVRRFHFDGIGTDRSRKAITVCADMTLVRKHRIRVQELPLLCRRLLETIQEPELATPITLTEDHMIAIEAAAQSTVEKKPHKPPRRPSPRVGEAWRNTRL